MRIIAGKYGWYFGREEPLKVYGPFPTWQAASEARIKHYAWVDHHINSLKRQHARRWSGRTRGGVRMVARQAPLRVTLGELVRAA
jgi:hypothetical protein